MHWLGVHNFQEVYDVDGKLSSMTNRAGRIQTLDYALAVIDGGDNDSTTLDKVTGFSGRTLSFSYDVNGRIESMTDPDSNVYNYSYDTNGNLTSVSYPNETPGNSSDNPTRLYHYEDTNHIHALTGITDETGNRFATHGYDAEGRAILSEHNGGTERINVVYNADGTTTVTDSLGQVQTYHFEALHGVVKVAQIDGSPCPSCGLAQNVSYDANGFVVSRTDFNGNITNYVNDARGLEALRTEAVGAE